MSARRLSSCSASSPIRSTQCHRLPGDGDQPRGRADDARAGDALQDRDRLRHRARRFGPRADRRAPPHHAGRRRLRLAAQLVAIVVQRARDLDDIRADLARRRVRDQLGALLRPAAEGDRLQHLGLARAFGDHRPPSRSSPGQPAPRAEQQQLDARGLQPERLGDFLVRRALRVGEPQQIALARLQPRHRARQVEAADGAAGGVGRLRISVIDLLARRRRGGSAFEARPPAMVAHQVGGDAEQVVAAVRVALVRDVRRAGNGSRPPAADRRRAARRRTSATGRPRPAAPCARRTGGTRPRPSGTCPRPVGSESAPSCSSSESVMSRMGPVRLTSPSWRDSP